MNRSIRARFMLGWVAVGALALAACSPDGSKADAPVASTADVPLVSDTDLEREPGVGADPALAEVGDLILPIQSEGATLVDPGWETTPQSLASIFMSPVDAGGYLEFTAVDSRGQALWALERPLACAGFTLTTGPDGVPIAVINDAVTTDSSLSATSASAYDLRTGELVWGPVDVPGPHQGPGLVYAAPSEAAMGASGPRMALSPITGEVLADESDSEWSVVAENHGTVLLSDGNSFRALDADGAQLWESVLPAGLNDSQAAASTSLGAGVQPLRAADGTLTIIELNGGKVLGDKVTSSAVDASTGTLVVTDPTTTRAVNIENGGLLWSTPSTAQAYVVSAGGAMSYVRDGDTIRVQNSITGDITPGYPESLTGVIAVPLIMTGTGAAAYPHENGVLLATEQSP